MARLPQLLPVALALFCLFVFLVSATPSSTLHFDRAPKPHKPQEAEALPEIKAWHILKDWTARLLKGHRTHDEQSSRLVNAPQPTPSTMPMGLFAAYQDQVVVRFDVNTVQEAEALNEASNVLFLDIWEASNHHVDIRLARNVLPSLLGLLPKTLQQPKKMVFHGGDLAAAIAGTYPSSSKSPDMNNPFQARRAFSPSLNAAQSNVFFREYRPFSVMVPWMRLLQSLFSSHTRLVTVGKTWEGRDIPAVRVGVHPTNDQEPLGPRKTIVVSGGSHAREWISTSTVNYVMYSLVSSYGRDPLVTRLLQDVDFLFVPTMNPDGYVYTWDYDRLWRKTRQPTPIRFCRGYDMDRTWGFHWDPKLQSSNPCSEDYAGEKPFASIESSTFAQWMKNETLNNNVTFIGLLDLHSYSQAILLPYSYSCADAPPALEDLEELGAGMGREIRRTYGEYFEVVSACEGNVLGKDERVKLPNIQSAGGNPLDWFYHELGIRYSYQIKLRDMGSYGFLLPPEYIIPQGEEIYNAVVYLAGSLLSSDTLLSKQTKRSEQSRGASQKPLLAS